MRFHPPSEPDLERQRFQEFLVDELHVETYIKNAILRAGYRSLQELRAGLATGEVRSPILGGRVGGLGPPGVAKLRGSIAAYDARQQERAAS